MAFSCISLAVVFFLTTASYSAPVPSPTSEGVSPVPAVYVFGDSLVDVGNNNYLKRTLLKANYPHNGIDFPNRKATGRFSNGKNSADFFAEKLGRPTSPPYLSLRPNSTKEYLAGVSFASGGAGILDSTNGHKAITMNQQVELFKRVGEGIEQQLGSAGAQNHLAKSIILIVIGSNDIFNFLSIKSRPNEPRSLTPEQFVNSMLLTFETQLKQMYNYGGRKFAVVGAGMVGCCPSQRTKNNTEGCNEIANYVCRKYNEGLKPLLQKLQSELKGFNYSYIDAYLLMQDVVQSPISYGFTEIKSACCGLGRLRAKVPCLPISRYCPVRDAHLFWDLYHPSEAFSHIFVERVYNNPQRYTSPVSVQQLTS